MASIMENYILKGNTSWDGPSEGYDFALRLERGVTARLLQLDASGWVLVEVIHPSEASKSLVGRRLLTFMLLLGLLDNGGLLVLRSFFQENGPQQVMGPCSRCRIGKRQRNGQCLVRL